MSNLDAIDRSASIFCLGLVALLMIVAPLFGVGEDRFHVTLNARTTQATIHRYSVPLPVGGEASISSGFEAASVAQPTHRPSTGRAASIDAKGARPAATAVVANIAAALPAFGGVRPAAAATFVCVDFVCVNRSTAVRNLFDYSPAAIAKLPIHTSFASCVQHCVATKASAGVTPEGAFAAAAVASASSSGVAAASGATTTTTTTTATSAAPASSLAILSPTQPQRQPQRQPQGQPQGLVHVGNRSLDEALTRWIALRHDRAREPCTASTPVYFAPFSPNGIGNKLMAVVMAFHMALMNQRRLVISDWPPRTLDVSYPLEELLQPSSCQQVRRRRYI